jgi:hypothetical protein
MERKAPNLKKASNTPIQHWPERWLNNRHVQLQLRNPAAHPSAVIFVFRTEHLAEMRFFIEDDEKMATQTYDERVSQHGCKLKKTSPGRGSLLHGCIHRVADEAVWPAHDKILWPRSRSSATLVCLLSIAPKGTVAWVAPKDIVAPRNEDSPSLGW